MDRKRQKKTNTKLLKSGLSNNAILNELERLNDTMTGHTVYIKGDKGDQGPEVSTERLIKIITPLIPKVKDGVSPRPFDVAAVLVRDKGFMEAVTGKDADPDEVARIIKRDKAFRDSLKPKDGESPKPSDVAYALMSNSEFVALCRPKDGSPDTPIEIAQKLNTLTAELDFKVLKNVPKTFSMGGKKAIHRGGSRYFTDLEDAPNSYGGHGGKVVSVKADESGLEFTTPSGGSGTPGGSDTQVQFNDGGTFGGDAGFAYDKTSGTVSVGGNVEAVGALESETGLILKETAPGIDTVTIEAPSSLTDSYVLILPPDAGSANQRLITDGSGNLSWTSAGTGIDHGGLSGLGDDDHTQYALLAGRSGGQTIIGGTATTDDLTLRPTSASGTSAALVLIQSGNNGATENARFGSAETVFNEGGADIDFRVESDTNANALSIDAGLDTYAFGVAATSLAKLRVKQTGSSVPAIMAQTDNVAGRKFISFAYDDTGSEYGNFQIQSGTLRLDILSTLTQYQQYMGADAIVNMVRNSGQPFVTLTNGTITGYSMHANTTDGFVMGALSNHNTVIRTNNTNRVTFTSAALMPSTNDTITLGTTANMWSDLFLASGGVINFNNGNATLTHSTGLLTSNVAFSIGTSNALTAGTIELGAATDTTISRSSAGVIAVEGVVIPSISSTNTLTNKTMTGATNVLTASLLKSATTEVSVSAATAPSSGQVLTATSSTTATWQTPSAGSGITWTEVTGTTQAAAVNSGYIANNASLVTITLPDTAPVGSIVRVTGKGAGGWKIAQNASEQIIWNEGGVDGTDETTIGTGGYLASTDDYDSVELVCLVADTTWGVLSSKGNITLA